MKTKSLSPFVLGSLIFITALAMLIIVDVFGGAVVLMYFGAQAAFGFLLGTFVVTVAFFVSVVLSLLAMRQGD